MMRRDCYYLRPLLIVGLLSFFSCAQCHSESFISHDQPVLYYVSPFKNVSQCPSQPCRTLTEYNVTSNSIYLFLPGTHIFTANTPFSIRGVTNVTLQGSDNVNDSLWTHPMVSLQCLQNENGGFFLQDVTNIQIKRLKILNCQDSIAIWVQNGANIQIYGLVVYNVYYGIYTENVHGNVSILESYFEAIDTNIYINFVAHNMAECNTPTDNVTTCTDNTTHNVSSINTIIQDVYTMGGYTGLYIHHNQPCHHGEIVIRNLHCEGSTLGGNVFIELKQHYQDVYRLIIENVTTVQGNSTYNGGGLAIIVTNANEQCIDETSSNLIHIVNTSIEKNTVLKRDGGGLYIKLDSLCRPTTVLINNVTFCGNRGRFGGQFAIRENITREEGQAKYQIVNCTITDGQSTNAQNALISVEYYYTMTSHESQFSDKIIILNTKFINNTAIEGNGGGLDITVFSIHLLSTIVNVVIQNSTFTKNQCEQQGSAVALLGDFPRLLYNITFLDVTIQEQISNSFFARVGAVYAESVFQVNFIDSSFLDNNSTALFLFNSDIYFQGTVSFKHNRGYNGGAITLCGASYVYFNYDSNVSFIGNIAEHVGGAIFVQENCFLSGITYCFYRIVFSNNGEHDFVGNLVFEDNEAKAGYDIYGGQLRDCTIDPAITSIGNDQFEMLFGSLLSEQVCSSHISSNPKQVLLCNNGCPDINVPRCMKAYPGKRFDISVAIAGQEQGLVPGVVHAFVQDGQTNGITIDDFQDSQTVDGNCTTVNYTVFGPTDITINLMLYAEQPDGSYLDTSEDYYFHTPSVTVEIALQKCPPAFSLSTDEQNNTICDCEPNLKMYGVECNIDDETLQPPGGVWIGYRNETHENDNYSTVLNFSSGTLLHPFCPLGYCESTHQSMTIANLDDQCSSNRSGVLCGKCKKGYSIMLGSSRCKRCSYAYIGLLPVFLLCGVMLVAFLRITNLTVSTATINGLIFYANVIHTNHSTFYPSKNHHILSKTLTVFLAWLNLDLGIETCLYDGMEAYVKLMLQYLFPIYIWILMITLMVIGHYKTGKIARFIIGQNGVQVLATLFLLSYTKLQRVVISTLHFTTLTYPNRNNKAVWVLDGNIEYLNGEHIPLFIAALVTLIFLIIPFTVLVTFAQLFQKILNYFRPGRNINARLWVFHDAYSGKYKDKYRFWTGLLLIARTTLLLVFTFNVHGDPNVNLLAIGLTSSCLLTFFSSATSGGMYKHKLLNLLELSFLFNLLLLSLCTLYIRQTKAPQTQQEIVSGISIGITFLTFIGILLYHLVKYTFWRHIDHLNRKLTHRYYSVQSDSQEDIESTNDEEASGEEVDSIEYILDSNGAVELVTVDEKTVSTSEDSSPVMTEELTLSLI